jgi:Family of unknown function (DUF6519)
MKGDFSRDSFNLTKNFSRVLMQQGRVQLDADFNEQSSILLHYLRTLTVDLIGQHAGVRGSFGINFINDGAKPIDLRIAAGHYYVDGILCENGELFNDKPVSYFNQPYYKPDDDELPTAPYIVYLDVWERHITCFEDESLCEVALGGVDTTTRAQVVWQVKIRKVPLAEAGAGCNTVLDPVRNVRLSARADQPQIPQDPCLIEPDARYRGAENQLYRVEIHTGNADEFGRRNPHAVATFKWSRENGSVIFPVTSVTISDDETEVALANLGRDDKFSLREGDWVELIDDAYTLNNRVGNLMQIAAIDRDEMSVSLSGKPKFPISENPENHPLLRRWDEQAGNRQEGGLELNTEGIDPDNAAKIFENVWLKLEDGIEIMFEPNSTYRTGDYWLIPARTITGKIIWSKDKNGAPQMQPPNGVAHHYAPLAFVDVAGARADCICRIEPLSDCLVRRRSIIGTNLGTNMLAAPPEDAEPEAAEPEAVKPKTAKPKVVKAKDKKPTK